MKNLFPAFLMLICSLSANSQDMIRVKNILDTLCSPAFHGRGYIENGDRKAAGYIEDQFSQIGLQSFNSSYFQKFDISINTFPGQMALKIGNHELSPGKDYILDPGSSSGTGKKKLYIFDTLLFNGQSVIKNFLKQDCKQILVYKAEDYPKILKLPQACIDKVHCFSATIELQKKKLTASVSQSQDDKVSFQVLNQSFSPTTKKIGYDVKADFKEKYPTQNVIGYIPGTSQPDSFIVISAHYDHLGRMGKEIYFPGANDNASGISMMLEFARFYKENSTASKYTMVFMAFAAEEAGLLGSKFFVNNPLFPLSKIKFLINLDLVGTGDDGITVVNGSIFEPEFKILTTLNDEKKYFSLIKKRGEAANSDHYFFYKKGVKSFFIYTLGGTTAYHDIYDTPKSLTLIRYKELFSLIKDFIGQY